MDTVTKLKVLDLFSGIGGFSLGLEETGEFETVAFCEQNEYAQKVLMKHWPDTPIFTDVRDIDGTALDVMEIGKVDVVCGGFPCQDISVAGKGEGLNGERSGLWYEMHRIIREVGPSWVIIENVSALRSRGLSTILQNLSEIGYDAEWHCIPASYVGAPHRRDRLWIVAYPSGMFSNGSTDDSQDSSTQASQSGGNGGKDYVPNAIVKGLEGSIRESEEGESTRPTGCSGDSQGWWTTEPSVGRVANGIPKRVDRLKCLGNAVVPQVVTLIAKGIINAKRTHQ